MDEFYTDLKIAPSSTGIEESFTTLYKPRLPQTNYFPQVVTLKRRSLSEELSLRIETLLVKNAGRVLMEDPNGHFSGKQIHQLVKAVSTTLKKLSAQKLRVAIHLPLSAVQGASILSVMSAKNSPLIIDSSQTEAQLVAAVEAGRISVIITDRKIEGLKISQIILKKEDLTVSEVIRGISSEAFVAEDEVLALNSSGSTGFPKTILLGHKNLAYMLKYFRGSFKLTSEDKALIQLPIFHTLSLNTQFLPAFLSGTACVFSDASLELQRGFRKILSTETTFLTMLPTMLETFEREMVTRNLPAASHVRIVQFSGGLISRRSLEIARKLFPEAIIYKGFGLTELIRTSMIPSTDPMFLTDTVGYPLPGQVIRVMSEDGGILRANQEGEICIKGPNVMLGYLGREESHLDADGFFKTGDFGYLDTDGRLYYSGRKDHVFKAQGKKVAPFEIEAISHKSQMVRASLCLAFPCLRKGLRPVLVMEAMNPGAFTQEEMQTLVDHLKTNLERYKIPKNIIVLDRLPRLPNGKIDRMKIQKSALDKVEQLQQLASVGGIVFNTLG